MLSPEQVRRRLGKVVTGALAKKGMRPEDFAEVMGLSGRSMRRIMQGQQTPLVATILEILSELDIHPVEVFGRTEPPGHIFRGVRSPAWRKAMGKAA